MAKCVVIALLTAAAFAANASPASAMRVGFLDEAHLFSEDPVASAQWLGRATSVGATVVRINVGWSEVSPTQPPPGIAADPAWTGYRWADIDRAVLAATAAGLRPLLTFVYAPDWAQGDAPRGVETSGWRPDVKAFSDFVRAAAVRYDGGYALPDGTALPEVRHWQAWNEPNLTLYLAPQWVRGASGGWRLEGPRLYRGLLNAAHETLNAVDARNFVVSAGTSPYGDPLPGGERVAPVMFTRDLLCLGEDRCSDRPRFDALAHHPYGVGGPRRRARNPDDAAIPDLGKLRALLRRAKLDKPLWVTEFSWDSSPPDPDGVPEHRHARWLEGALFEFWRQRVPVALWLGIGDHPPKPSYSTTYQSGIYLDDGTPKAAAQAMAFPFVAQPAKGKKTHLWGMAPEGARRVTIERSTGDRWRRLTTVGVARDRVFAGRFAVPKGARLRAVAGRASSLAWTVGVDGR